MARWAEHKQKNPRDAFDYPLIGRIADRVIIMAYDEHYRTGLPVQLPHSIGVNRFSLMR